MSRLHDIKTVFVPSTRVAVDKVLKELTEVAKANRTKSDWAAMYEVKNYILVTYLIPLQ